MASKTEEKAILQPAFLWICPNCHCENFEKTRAAEFSQEEIAELRYEHGIDPLQDGEFTTSPTVVECRNCHIELDATIDDLCD